MDREDEIRWIVSTGYLRESVYAIAQAADCDVATVEHHIREIIRGRADV